MTLYLPRHVLEEARAFFEGAGTVGTEGTGMLAGHLDAGDEKVTRFVAPDQLASREPACWVEVTEQGKLHLAVSLASDERWLARIHSHPGRAFHSPTDDANPAITAEGAWSIVVPYFGLGLRHGIAACAVLRRIHGRWTQLRPEEVDRLIQVVDCDG